MLTIRTCAHIPTNRRRNSFRVCPASTGVPLLRLAASASLREEIRLSNAQSRLEWLREMWQRHTGRIQFRSGRKVQ
jgi:hypothetical protein